MAQLIMNWTDSAVKQHTLILPQGITLVPFPEITDAVSVWLDIVRFLDKNGKPISDENYYKKTMLDIPNYNENLCYFLLVDSKPAATITVICDYQKKEGLIHMVACKPDFRGKGLGHLLNDVAVNTLKKEGMKTARLTTDDWRIAAIKTYLKAGFVPDLDSEPDFKERWQKIYETIDTF